MDWWEFPTPSGLFEVAACQGIVWGLAAGSGTFEGQAGRVYRLNSGNNTWSQVDNPGTTTLAVNISCNPQTGQPFIMKPDGTLWSLQGTQTTK
jgi:hypothetical protein